MSSYEAIRYEVDDGVATLTLDRPDKHNAFSPTMIDEVQDVWHRLRLDDDVRVAVLTGAGEKAFTVGIDLTFQYPQPSSKLTINDPMLRIGPKTNDLWKPVIAAVNGMACGGAFYLLGEAEFIIAAEHATFFDPHVTHGMPSVYESMFMVQRMPVGEIMRIALLGRHERMTAQRAFQVGLAQEVVPGADLLATAQRVARIIADAPDPLAVEATVKAVWTATYMSIHQALQTAPTLINLIDSTSGISERADALRRQNVQPSVR
jgi:enoyl-CoA hydratase/carnithine racemase